MRFEVVERSVLDAECDVLIVGVFEGEKEPSGAAGKVDQAVGGALSALIERERFEGKIGQIADFTPSGDIKASRVVIVGLGKQEELNADKVRRASSAAARRARDLSAKRVATTLHSVDVGGIEPELASRALVEGAILGTYQFIIHKTVDVKPNPIETVEILEADAANINAVKSGTKLGQAIAEAKNFARDLINEPANILTPSQMAERASQLAREVGLECRVIGQDEMKQMGMNLILAVAKGSSKEPKLVVMRYRGSGDKTVAIVGKGITFDAGGINLKHGEGLHMSKVDMSGSAAVLATMRAIATLRPKVNVLALMPMTDNMPGGNATYPGDVIVGLSGKSVEVNNTDAEGRLILSDSVAFAEREGVDEIIDIATLTGACVTALGCDIAGILGTDQGLVDKLIQAGAVGGENLWQLPLHPEYEDALKSDVADVANSGGKGAGAITGGLFIKSHIQKTPWVHIDIAGPSVVDADTPIGPKGGTGFGTSTLINYLISR